MNLRLLSAVVCVGFLTLAAPVYGAQSSDVVVDGAQRGDVQQTRYRETLLSLRDTLTVVRANMSRVRRQLATAGPETLQSWVVTLNRACGGSVTALENAEPTFQRRGTDRVSVASRPFRQSIARLQTVLQLHCIDGLSPEGPGQWIDSLRAWAPYRIGQIERQLSDYDREASRFAKAAGFKLEPKVTP